MCPRCDQPYGERPPAASRSVPNGEIEVCEDCGRDEALRDALGHPRVTPDKWPVAMRYAPASR